MAHNGFYTESSVNQRLRAAVDFAVAPFSCNDKKKLVIADVGADHAYLSIYLAKHFECEHIYATEINELPAKKAIANIARCTPVERHNADGSKTLVPVSELVSVRVCDGLSGLEECGINRVIICGMGGEVISGIISRAPFVRTQKIPLVLQPMSKEMELRQFLCENGFEIVEEKLLRDADRIYTVIKAVYDGKKRNMSPSELMLGKRIISYFTEKSRQSEGFAAQTEMFCELVNRKLGHAKNKLRAQNADENDKKLFEELCELKNQIENIQRGE